MSVKLINYKKYLVDYEGEGKGGAHRYPVQEEAFRKYSESLVSWLRNITVPRNDKDIQVEVVYGYPEFATALRATPSQQVKPEVNRELGEKLVDLREDRTRVPIISYFITNYTYDQSRELPGEIYYKGKFVDDSKKDIVMLNKEVPFILQYTLAVWTKFKADMAQIQQQLLSRFNPNVVFLVDNQEIPCRLDGITDTSALEAKDGNYQLVRNDVIISMDAWLKRDPVSVRTILRERVQFSESAITANSAQEVIDIMNINIKGE
jgi:hypothetical protein